MLPTTPASATINTGASASDIANAIDATPGLVTGASFETLPPSGTPDAVSDTALTSFPRNGSDYGILTTGDAGIASSANDSASSGASDGGGTPAGRGDSAFDVSVLKVDLSVPNNADCLSVDFQFLSEEYPEFVGQTFNDAFIAELDTSDWSTSGSTISAPSNFAFDPSHNVISINGTGVTSMSAGAASGTTYDGATELLSAQTPVSPGVHSVYFSIFDQGDSSFDSAVFLDNMVVGQSGEGGCQAGAQLLPLTVTKTAASSTVAPGAAAGYTINVANPNATDVALSTITDDLPAGFTYLSGSSSDATSSDPAISGQTLTWGTELSVPAGGSVSLSFQASASIDTGDYYNNAGATSPDASVTPSGDTALVTVVGGGGTGCGASVPGAPTNVQAFAGDASAAVSWTAPDSDGGAPIESYTVNIYDQSGEAAPVRAPISSASVQTTGTSAQIDGLINGDTYTFTVQAANCAGPGPESEPSGPVVPAAGSSAQVIDDGNLSQTTGTTTTPTPGDTTIGKQTFPPGTTGIGTLEELSPSGPLAVRGAVPIGQFCGGSTCIGNVLQAELHDGHLGLNLTGGLPFYKIKLLLDKTLVKHLGLNVKIWYDGNLADDNEGGADPTPPARIFGCSPPFTGTPCIIRISRVVGYDLKVVVKTQDLDPRLSTSK